MEFKPSSAMALSAFLLIIVSVIAVMVAGNYSATLQLEDRATAKRNAICFTVGFIIWLAVLSVVVGTGMLQAEPMPRLLIFFGSANLVGFLFAASPAGGTLARGLPIAALVGFQAFRLPLEVVLHSWGVNGTIPMAMTWDGLNLDAVSGIVALLAAPLAGRFRGIAWTANLTGMVLLGNVARVAIMSAPLPFGWQSQPPLLLAYYLPYALIVPVCIAGALAGHIVLTRRLLMSPLQGV